MAVLTPDVPMTVTTPRLLVENKLAPGKYRFRLVVIDDQGLPSEPTELTVSILEASPPPPRDTPIGTGTPGGTVSPTPAPASTPSVRTPTAPTPPGGTVSPTPAPAPTPPVRTPTAPTPPIGPTRPTTPS
jgi:hypothetical protein